MSLRSTALDDPVAIRLADRDLLSLALIDARNLSLRWLEVFERRDALERSDGGAPAWWRVGHAAYWQEWWIARNVQRGRGEAADARVPRLASIERRADGWFALPSGTGGGIAPPADRLRRYLAETLDTTLELLAAAVDDDEGLFFFRAALLHEDRLAESLAELAAGAQFQREPDPPPPWAPLPTREQRQPLWLPASETELGSRRGGFVPDNERWAEALAVPEFEIDAQPVSWARWVEFAEDGGYDRAELWSESGNRWLQTTARRAPRDVEQQRGSVVLQRGGALRRVPAGQAVMHVSRHEAEAWCRWAGRRLPTEPEWESAATGASRRGFAWGEVFEWVAGSARPWSGHRATPGTLDALPALGSLGVLRGGSFMTAARWRHPKARRFAPADTDRSFAGFRSCAPA